ncbi:MAG: class I SAM-dependent methyltransferase [Rhodospirillales bacterium]|jgi:ubiquinone/menaquinone biosynthesis C-methylase UbiE|nr:class I SAM-dependent methyltransferase [Rhodospirillales bacterium]
MSEFRTNGSVLREHLQLEGLHIVDIGSGAGDLVRYMTKHGAKVVGLECGAAQLKKANESPLQGDETYVEGFGQDMPFNDGQFDAAVFFNSLHHVPPEHMTAALSEASRVVKNNGTIYIAEPLASGTGFELHAPIDDETEVRKLALQAIHSISTSMSGTREVTYSTSYFYDDYEDFRAESIRIDPVRQPIFDDRDDALRANFDKLGEMEEKGYRFDQPMRINILTQ